MLSFEALTESVYHVKCGTEEGTAFLISDSLALTAFHVIKGHDQNEIILNQFGSKDYKAKLHNDINDKYKKLDVALLVLEEKINIKYKLRIANIEKVTEGTKWVSRGYPACKSTEGENILNHEDNTVNQQLPQLKNGKYDIQLNHNQKWESFAGFSGAPLVIDGNIVGLINTELTCGSKSMELNALSIRHFKDLLSASNIGFIQKSINSEDGIIDQAGVEDFRNLQSNDLRNLPDKLAAVCPEISDQRIGLYCRELASGKNEMIKFSDDEVSSMKYRVFEVCQNELLDFVESCDKSELTIKDLKYLMDKYEEHSEQVIMDRSQDYRYPLHNRNFLRKIVLDLINDCFLSFDKEGIYEE